MTIELDKRTCQHCRYWTFMTGEQGYCNRFPRHLKKHACDWCGEWMKEDETEKIKIQLFAELDSLIENAKEVGAAIECGDDEFGAADKNLKEGIETIKSLIGQLTQIEEN